MNRSEAEKAVKEGVKRWGCELKKLDITDDEITIIVKGTQDNLQIGREYNWQKYSPEQLQIRVSRFCTTYANGISYHFSWDKSFT